MKLEYSLRARANLLNIYSYLNEQSPQAAVTVVREIVKQIETLLDFPRKGAVTSVPGARRLTITRYPYFVFYRVQHDTVSILHIRHTSRRRWGGGTD